MLPALALTAILPSAAANMGGSACTLAAAFFRARLSGVIERRVDWQARDMQCDGERRPDGAGFRLSFAALSAKSRLALVLGVPNLSEGADGRAVPVNVTIIRGAGHLYGTRGTDKCVLDQVHQTRLADDGAAHRWQVAARGFCLEPARAVGAGPADDAILLATFDFVGLLTWVPDTPAKP